MKIFYVDFENVKDSGLNGIAKLNSKDVVKIFYSEDANKITFGTHRRITESPATVEYFRMRQDMKGVKNALDVFLMNDLSQRINEAKNAEFYIVSADGDFDNYIQEKKKKKISVSKIPEICKASQSSAPVQAAKVKTDKKARTDEKKEQAFRSHFGKYLKAFYADDKESIMDAYMRSNTRQELNNNLQQIFCNEDVSDILRRMSDLIKNMPGK